MAISSSTLGLSATSLSVRVLLPSSTHSLTKFLRTQRKCVFGSFLTFYLTIRAGGKSAVLSALTIALGGKANHTGRGAGLKAFIREGQGCATRLEQTSADGLQRCRSYCGHPEQRRGRVQARAVRAYDLRDAHHRRAGSVDVQAQRRRRQDRLAQTGRPHEHVRPPQHPGRQPADRPHPRRVPVPRRMPR